MENDNRPETLEWGIIEVHRVLNRVYSSRYKQEELNLTQAAALGWLMRKGQMSQTDLAKHLFLKRPATGDLVDFLESHAWVIRSPALGDRRTWLIDLTDSGRKKLKTVNNVVLELREAMSEGLSDEQILAFMTTLDLLKSNLERIEASKP